MSYIRFILLTAIILIGTLQVNAQTQKDTVVNKVKAFTFDVKSLTQDFRMGFHLTPTFGNLNTEGQDLITDNAAFLSYGIMFDKYILGTDRYAFTTGLSVTNKGGKFNKITDFSFEEAFPGETFTATDDIKLRLRYLEIPLAIRVRSNPIKQKFVAYGTAGWINGFRMRARANAGEFEAGDIKKDVRFFNFSLMYGLGVEYKLGKESTAMLGFIFNSGLTDVLKNFDERVETNTFGIQLGIFY